MNEWAPIKYKGFWDFPRIFIARHRGETFLFDCAFDEALDDYPDTFKAFLMPSMTDEDLPKDWTHLSERATRFLGDVPVRRIIFDPTKRQQIEISILDELLSRKAAG